MAIKFPSALETLTELPKKVAAVVKAADDLPKKEAAPAKATIQVAQNLGSDRFDQCVANTTALWHAWRNR